MHQPCNGTSSHIAIALGGSHAHVHWCTIISPFLTPHAFVTVQPLSPSHPCLNAVALNMLGSVNAVTTAIDWVGAPKGRRNAKKVNTFTWEDGTECNPEGRLGKIDEIISTWKHDAFGPEAKRKSSQVGCTCPSQWLRAAFVTPVNPHGMVRCSAVLTT